MRSDHNVSTETIAAVVAARRSGVRVVLTSARPPRMVKHLYEALGLTTLQINYNGAVICDPYGENKTFYHLGLEPELCQAVVAFTREHSPKVALSFEVLDTWHSETDKPEGLPEEALKNFCPTRVGPLDECLQEPVTKMMLFGDPAQMKLLRKDLLENFSKRIAVARNRPYMMQIIHPDVDKGRAIRRVAEHYDIPREQVMAVGDESNDVGMLEWAGIGVAVNNATLPARAAADVIVSSNDENGVAEAIRKYVVDGDPPPSSSGGAG